MNRVVQSRLPNHRLLSCSDCYSVTFQSRHDGGLRYVPSRCIVRSHWTVCHRKRRGFHSAPIHYRSAVHLIEVGRKVRNVTRINESSTTAGAMHVLTEPTITTHPTGNMENHENTCYMVSHHIHSIQPAASILHTTSQSPYT